LLESDLFFLQFFNFIFFSAGQRKDIFNRFENCCQNYFKSLLNESQIFFFVVVKIVWIASLAIIVSTFSIENYYSKLLLLYLYFNSIIFQSVQIKILPACLAKNQKEIKKEISELKKNLRTKRTKNKISRGAS